MHFNFIIILAASCCLHLTTAGLYPQYFQSYQFKSCIGPATNFLQTTNNVTGIYPEIGFISTSLRGIWRHVHDAGYTIERTFNGGQTCTTRIDPPIIVIESVQKLASGDLDDSVLTLYPQSNFEGESLVINEQNVSKVERENFTIASWVFTGPQSFTVFDAENFAGNATCLQVESASRNDGYGISVKWNMEFELSVRSVRMGCEGTVMSGDSKKSILTRNANRDGVIEKLETIP